MNVALVHDSLVEFGGSERIFRIFLELFPKADVYTAFADTRFLKKFFPGVSPRTSYLQSFPIGNHTSLVQALSPVVWQQFDLSAYDLVISHSDHLGSVMVRVPHGVHISYIPSLPKNIFGIAPPTPLQRIIRYDQWIKPYYLAALPRTHIVTNSRHTQSVFKKFAGMASTVIYPPVTLPKQPVNKFAGRYFLCVSRIAPGKHLDIAIQAANMLHIPLRIAGVSNTPQYEKYLRHLAGPTVRFLGYQSDAVVAKLYQHAWALVFPSENEDFGITPLEANAHAVPVVAYYGGGAKETVIDKKTGLFFRLHTAESLADAMTRIRSMRFSAATLRDHARSFSETRFKKAFMRYVRRAVRESEERTKVR